MDFLTATTTYVTERLGLRYVTESAVTHVSLTNQALDLLNFFSQLVTVSFGIMFGLMVLAIIIIIFKS